MIRIMIVRAMNTVTSLVLHITNMEGKAVTVTMHFYRING